MVNVSSTVDCRSINNNNSKHLHQAKANNWNALRPPENQGFLKNTINQSDSHSSSRAGRDVRSKDVRLSSVEVTSHHGWDQTQEHFLSKFFKFLEWPVTKS